MITRSGPSSVEPALEHQISSLARGLPAIATPGRPDRAGWFEVLHRLSAALPSRPLSAQVLLEQARRATGLDDFGADFGHPAEGLSAWLDGMERAGSIDPLGRRILSLEVGWMLRSRLGVTEALRRQPAIAAAPIVRPLFVLGLPRSGTTLLHRLLASCEGCRAPLMWELRRPEPPPPGDPERNIRSVQRQLRALLAVRPDFLSIHPLAWDEPEECVIPLHHTFLTMHCDVVARAPSYLAWLRSQDLRPAYRYHRAVLQRLAHDRPPAQWVLKSPAHLHALDALLQVYPDALFVHVHRDVIEVAPSGCSLTTAGRCILARSIDRSQLGAEWLDNWSEALDRGLRARDQIEPARIIDVRYEELVQAPERVIRRVREYFGYPAPAAMEPVIERQRARHDRARYGAHEYTLSEFGLEAGAVRERFADYVRRFGLDQPADLGR